MRKFFSLDHPVFRGISRLGDMFLMSFFWIITSIPIITIGASTTALIDCAIKIVRQRDTSVFKDFFKSFKKNFKASTVIFILMALIGGLLYIDIYFWGQVGGIQALVIGGLTAGLCFIYGATLIFVFAVQAVFENSIKDTIKTAFFMAMKHLPTSILLVVFVGVISYMCWIFPVIAFFMLVFGIGAVSLIFAVQYITIFSKHNSEFKTDNPPEE